jgi:hypothetical protein
MVHVTKFQCSSYGHDFEQSIGRWKSAEHVRSSGRGIGIKIDTNRLADAAEECTRR